MAAGFRGPLFLLGLSKGSAVQAGFRGPLPLPNLGATAVADQAGFRGALPLPFLGAGTVVQAGFRSALPLPFLGAGAITEPEGGPSDGAFLQDDDEVIMLVARAFLTLVN